MPPPRDSVEMTWLCNLQGSDHEVCLHRHVILARFQLKIECHMLVAYKFEISVLLMSRGDDSKYSYCVGKKNIDRH